MRESEEGPEEMVSVVAVVVKPVLDVPEEASVTVVEVIPEVQDVPEESVTGAAILAQDEVEVTEFSIGLECTWSLFTNTGDELAVEVTDVGGVTSLALRLLLLLRFTLGESGRVNVTSPKSRKRMREKKLVNVTLLTTCLTMFASLTI